jgi:hypothetical protein
MFILQTSPPCRFRVDRLQDEQTISLCRRRMYRSHSLNRLGVSLNENGLEDTIRARYEESLQKVLPIKKTLRKTDALRDAYRFYGLTEGEIRVVEGKA